MKIAIDGLPLAVPKTGVGHYTTEVALGVATVAPNDEFHVVTHVPFIPDSINGNLPANLKYIQQPVNTLTRHWWSTGLPLYIRRNAIDLFHGTNYDVPLWAGCPTVLTIHDLSPFLFAETHAVRHVIRARRRLPIMARVARRIIVPTHSVRREVNEHLPGASEKVVVIPDAARACFRPQDPASAKETLVRLGIEESFLLYVGAIEPRKNLITLVKALEEIYQNTDLRPQLVIAGPTAWLADELFDYVDHSDVKARISLPGYLSDEDLRALYSTCAMMCYPALYEGAGLPPLEAMACGAPVVTSDASAIAEMVGKAGRLFPATDYQALASHITELLTDPKARDELIQRGLERVSGFSWERTAAATYEIYRELAAQDRF